MLLGRVFWERELLTVVPLTHVCMAGSSHVATTRRAPHFSSLSGNHQHRPLRNALHVPEVWWPRFHRHDSLCGVQRRRASQTEEESGDPRACRWVLGPRAGLGLTPQGSLEPSRSSAVSGFCFLYTCLSGVSIFFLVTDPCTDRLAGVVICLMPVTVPATHSCCQACRTLHVCLVGAVVLLASRCVAPWDVRPVARSGVTSLVLVGRRQE